MITPFSGDRTVLAQPTCSQVADSVGQAGRTGQYMTATLRDGGRMWSVSLPVYAVVVRNKKAPELAERCVWAAVLAEDGDGTEWKRRPLLLFPSKSGLQRWSSTRPH